MIIERSTEVDRNLDEFLIREDQPLLEALRKINDNRQGFLVVVGDDEKLLGTLTDGDIRRALLSGAETSSPVAGHYNYNCRSLREDDEFSNAIRLFREHTITFVPEVDGDGRVSNILTKEALHALLLQDIQPVLSDDFTSVDKSVLKQEIYERPWGFYKTCILSDTFQCKVISVKPLGQLSLQEHKKREEHWVVIKGEGEVVLGESIINASAGKYIFIPKGCKHRMRNASTTETLMFVEVQLGQYFGEDDIIRYEDIYGREGTKED